MAVDVTTEPAFRAGRPTKLFEGPYFSLYPIRSYDVAPDGQRFLMLRDDKPGVEPATEMNVILNWFEELKRLVPTP